MVYPKRFENIFSRTVEVSNIINGLYTIHLWKFWNSGEGVVLEIRTKPDKRMGGLKMRDFGGRHK